MPELSEQVMLEKLKGFDTPSIANIVASYPHKPLCLALYNPSRGNWYTDQSVHCMYPELGRLVGYAVTIVFSPPDPIFKRLSLLDLIDALEKSKKPSIIIMKQDFPPEILAKKAGSGGNMTTLFKACGAVGVIMDGPTRDLEECRPLRVQYLATGLTPASGVQASITAINVPVSVAGMDVSPGEIIHMDENGACKFPADRLADVCKNVKELVGEEEERVRNINTAKNIEEIKAAWTY